MAASLLAFVAAGLLAMGGLCVLMLRRAAPHSVGIFSLLALWAAATVSAATLTGAEDLREATLGARLLVWYSLPLPWLMLVVALPLLGVPPRASVLALGAAITGAACGAMALWEGAFLAGVGPFAGGFALTSGPLLYVLTGATALIEAGIAWAGARVATGAGDALARQRARWVGIAFGLMPLHAGGFFLAYVVALPAGPGLGLFWARAIPTLVAGGVAAVALARLLRPVGPRALVLASLVLVLGLLDGVVGAQRVRGLATPGFDASVLVVRVAFAAILSTVAVRFGLADAGARTRRSTQRATSIALRVATGIALAAGALAFLGGSTIGAAVGLAVVVALVAVPREPYEAGGRALARALLLPPDDPRAVAERARTYAAAVAAARDAGPEGARYLAELREDLGVTEREHELLAQGLASRDKPRYQTLETLGAGATAQVELAVDEVAGKRVVVKRFAGLRDPSAALREARALAAVRHPRVVPFLEVDRRDDGLYLVLAYAEGGSARQLLDREGPLPPMRAVGLTADLLEGLQALHAAGIVHCDVKPENLLLDASGRGLLGDFGSAKFAAPDVVDATLAGGAAEGSLSTISPEALRGAPPAPARDVYAAGATLYRLLTGEHYVDLRDATVFEARERITMDAPRLPHARVPPPIADVLRKALAKRPEDRHASAEEMREALLRAAARAPA